VPKESSRIEKEVLKPLNLFLISLSLINLSACSRGKSLSPAAAQPTASLSQQQKTEASPSLITNSPIRSIDFENFTYPVLKGGGTFKLKDGVEPAREDRRSLVDVVYCDVTADGTEDALVVHSQRTRGSAIPYYLPHPEH
jgi:hypothetical protein